MHFLWRFGRCFTTRTLACYQLDRLCIFYLHIYCALLTKTMVNAYFKNHPFLKFASCWLQCLEKKVTTSWFVSCNCNLNQWKQSPVDNKVRQRWDIFNNFEGNLRLGKQSLGISGHCSNWHRVARESKLSGKFSSILCDLDAINLSSYQHLISLTWRISFSGGAPRFLWVLKIFWSICYRRPREREINVFWL